MMEDALSQEEIDRLFHEHVGAPAPQSAAPPVAGRYDFRRPDRIPKDQLRSVHLVHDFLARNLASSLGAYLRAYVTVNLVSVEQLSFGEFIGYLPTPTCVASVAVEPLENNAVLEINPSLVMPILDIVLGGSGRDLPDQARELTEIEQNIMQGILRIILHDLSEAWAAAGELTFEVEDTETQPQLLQVLSPNEAVVGIGFEMTVAGARGMLNFGVPSVMVKMSGQRLEQQWSVRRRSPAADERKSMSAVLRRAPVEVAGAVRGGAVRMGDILDLREGDVLSLASPIDKPVDVTVNGVRKFSGEVVASGGWKALRLVSGELSPGEHQ